LNIFIKNLNGVIIFKETYENKFYFFTRDFPYNYFFQILVNKTCAQRHSKSLFKKLFKMERVLMEMEDEGYRLVPSISNAEWSAFDTLEVLEAVRTGESLYDVEPKEHCNVCYNQELDFYECPNHHLTCDDCVDRIKKDNEYGIFYICPFCRVESVIEFAEGSDPVFPIELE
jgi:hypothetical protein